MKDLLKQLTWVNLKPFIVGLVIGSGVMVVALGASYLANGHL